MAREPGQIEESWDDPQLLSAIGKFVIQLSQLEYISRSAALEGVGDRASARASSSRACQYSAGRSSPGAKAGAGRAFLLWARAIFSISFLLGMRQLAGRSVILD